MELGRKAEILLAGILAVGAAGCHTADGKPSGPVSKTQSTPAATEAPMNIADTVTKIDVFAADAATQLARIDYSKKENNVVLEAAVQELSNYSPSLTGNGGQDFKSQLEATVAHAHVAAGNASESELKADLFLVQGFDQSASRVATYGSRPVQKHVVNHNTK